MGWVIMVALGQAAGNFIWAHMQILCRSYFTIISYKAHSVWPLALNFSHLNPTAALQSSYNFHFVLITKILYLPALSQAVKFYMLP